MAISEIPSKLIERTESLTERKLGIASDLTKIIYEHKKEPVTQEEVLKTYVRFYESIKELIPSPLDNIKTKSFRRYVIISLVLSVIGLALYVFLGAKIFVR